MGHQTVPTYPKQETALTFAWFGPDSALGINIETLTKLESDLLSTTNQDQMSSELMRGRRLNPLIWMGPVRFKQTSASPSPTIEWGINKRTTLELL
jgi:hypothetical protein